MATIPAIIEYTPPALSIEHYSTGRQKNFNGTYPEYVDSVTINQTETAEVNYQTTVYHLEIPNVKVGDILDVSFQSEVSMKTGVTCGQSGGKCSTHLMICRMLRVGRIKSILINNAPISDIVIEPVKDACCNVSRDMHHSIFTGSGKHVATFNGPHHITLRMRSASGNSDNYGHTFRVEPGYGGLSVLHIVK